MRRVNLWALVASLVLAGCVSVNVRETDEEEARRPAEPPPAPQSPWPVVRTALPIPAAQLGDVDWGEALGELGRVATGITLGAEHGTLFYGYDTLAYPGKRIDLSARVLSAETLQGLSGVMVGFYRDEQRIGQAVTDKNGVAAISFTPPEPGHYPLSARIEGVGPAADAEEAEALRQAEPARLLVTARPKDAPIAVVDLDRTLVGSGFHTVLLGTARPMPGSQAVMDKLAERYTIVYLTHRPDLLTGRSKDWLARYKYPPGPVLVSTVREAVGGSESFKSAKLAELREAYPNIQLGIGDKLSDVLSYASAGVPAYWIPHYDPDDPEELAQLARDLRRLPPNVQVVQDWSQIEAGVFGEARFAPQAIAEQLERRARRLLRIRRLEERFDD